MKTIVAGALGECVHVASELKMGMAGVCFSDMTIVPVATQAAAAWAR
jgi:hypothetical protein